MTGLLQSFSKKGNGVRATAEQCEFLKQTSMLVRLFQVTTTISIRSIFVPLVASGLVFQPLSAKVSFVHCIIAQDRL